MKKFLVLALAGTAAAIAAAPASATVLDISSGFTAFSGARSSVGTGFTDTFTFSNATDRSISGTVDTHWLRDVTTSNVISDLDFVTVSLDGTLWTRSAMSSDMDEDLNLASRMLLAGDHTLTVNYNVDTATEGAAAGYAGILTLGAPGSVPEPATWAMFVGAFGLVGAGMRQRRARVAFSA